MNKKKDSELTKVFAEQGFIVVKNLFQKSSILAASDAIDDIDDSLSLKRYSRMKRIEREKYDGLLKRKLEFFRLAINKDVIQKVESILGEGSMIYRDSLIRRAPFSENGHAFHQDSAYWPIEPKRLVSVWIPFQDTDADI